MYALVYEHDLHSIWVALGCDAMALALALIGIGIGLGHERLN